MLKSFWKAAWRNIVHHRIFAIINILGLALGICFCLVIFLVVRYEFSFDRFHPDGDRIYRVGQTIHIGDLESWNTSRVMPALPEAIKREVSGVEAVTGFCETPDMHVSLSKTAMRSGSVADGSSGSDSWAETLLVQPDYFSMFRYEWLAGNARSLQKPFQIVLSASRARQYFGNMPFAEIMGKQLMLNDTISLYVSGIVKGWTENSDLLVSNFISFGTINGTGLERRYSTDTWGGVRGHADIWTFIKLLPGVDPKKVIAQLDAVVKAHIPRVKEPEMNLLPISEIHFDSSYSHDDIRKAHKLTLYGVVALASFILILAVINFINLSTAQSIRRSREVGIRKVLGARVSGLVLLLCRDFIRLVGLSILIATPIAWWAMHQWLNGFAFRIRLDILLFVEAGLAGIGIALVTVTLQAVRAARVNPLKSLKAD